MLKKDSCQMQINNNLIDMRKDWFAWTDSGWDLADLCEAKTRDGFDLLNNGRFMIKNALHKNLFSCITIFKNLGYWSRKGASNNDSRKIVFEYSVSGNPLNLKKAGTKQQQIVLYCSIKST